MKSKIFFILLLLITISFIDNKLYFVGRSLINFKYLPLNLKTTYWDSDYGIIPNGFRLEDEFGFMVLEKGGIINLNEESITISNIIEYTFDEKTIIFKVQNDKEEVKYIEIKKNENQYGSLFLFKISNSNNNFKKKWYKSENTYDNVLVFIRNIFIILTVIYIIKIFLVSGPLRQ